jgi:hypothetical protein
MARPSMRATAAAITAAVMFGAGGLAAQAAVVSPWLADLANVPAGTMGCNANGASPAVVELKKQWDYWDNCGGSVLDPATVGLPNPTGGKQRVVRWQKTTSSDQVYQKLNRTFTKDNWPRGGSGKSGSPADVSGRYVTHRFIPSSDLVLNPRHGWLVLMSFKENYLDASGNFRQDGTGWKLGCNNFTAGFTGTVRCAMTPKKSFNLADYTNRWVKWEYRVYQGAKDKTGHGGRIELWADDKLIDTGYEGESGGHVGSAAFVPLNRTQAWVFTVGQYTSNQSTNGVPDWKGTHMTSYVGPTSLTPIA